MIAVLSLLIILTLSLLVLGIQRPDGSYNGTPRAGDRIRAGSVGERAQSKAVSEHKEQTHPRQ